MKKILIATALLAALGLAFEVAPVGGTSRDAGYFPRLDSLRKADSALIAEQRKEISITLTEQHAKDSALFANRIPDSLKARIAFQMKEFEVRKASFDSIKTLDSAKIAGFRLKADSLRKAWEAKRDSQITKIKDTAVQAKVKARIAEIEKNRAEVKAKIDARKAEIEAKIAELKARLQKPSTAPTTK